MSPGLFTPDSAGAYQPAIGLWATDAAGVFRPAKAAWASKADGSYTQVWPTGSSVGTFTAAPGAIRYTQVKLSWVVTNAAHIEIRLSGSTKILHTDTNLSGNWTFTGTPGATYTFVLRSVAADATYQDSSPQTITIGTLPAPGNFRRGGGTSTGSFWLWNQVPGADTYQVVDTLHSNAVRGTVNDPTLAFAEVGLSPSTTYERGVRANLGAAQSPVSNKVRYTTPATPGPAPGTYDFPAVYAEAWAPGYNYWRGAGAGIVHGDGDNWGGNNGYNVTCFYYNLAAIHALAGGRVTRAKIRIARDSTAGYSGPQGNHFIVHTAPTRPAGSPVGGFGASVDAGSLSWGQEAAFDVPVAWGQSIVDNYLGTSGFAWGYVPARYMRGPSLAAHPDQGHLYLTIG